MKGLEFPLYGTKIKGLDTKFDITNPEGRKAYFESKVGKEIEQIREFMKNRTFVANMVGKKNSGKGTYSKLFMEAVGAHVTHLSIGDIIRDVHKSIETSAGKKKLVDFLKKNYGI